MDDMFESRFCGLNDSLNLDQLWNSTVPHFSKCFLKTIPFWVPSVFLWLFAPIEVYFLLKKRYSHHYRLRHRPIVNGGHAIPCNCYNLSRLICILILILSNILQLFHDLYYFDPLLRWFDYRVSNPKAQPSAPADIYASLLNIVTFILFACFTQLHRRQGKHTSGVGWIFMFLSLFFYSPIIYTFVVDGFDSSSTNSYLHIGLINSSSRQYLLPTLFIIHASMLLAIFLLTCFADQKPNVTTYIPVGGDDIGFGQAEDSSSLLQTSTTTTNNLTKRVSKQKQSPSNVNENFVDSFELNSPYEPNGTLGINSNQPLTARRKSTITPDTIECPQIRSSFLSQITFWWFNTMAITGFRRTLKMEDLWQLNPKDTTREVAPKFDKNWQLQCEPPLKKRYVPSSDAETSAKLENSATIVVSVKDQQQKQKTASIVWTLARTFGWLFLSGAIFKFGHDVLQFIAPQLLKLFIEFVKKPSDEEPVWHGYFIAALFFVVATVQSMMLNYYFYIMFVIGMRVRTSLVSAIYRKALTLSNAARKEITTGEIVNLMSVDAQRFVDLLPFLNLIWSSPLQIMLAIYFLWMELGPSVLAGLAVMVMMIPLNGYISSYQRKLQMAQMKKKDERVKVINELLNGIRVIKLYAWEVPFIKKVSSIRKNEIDYLKKIGYLHSATAFLWTCAPFIVSFVTFAIYVLSSEDNILDPQKAFVSLSLFNLLRFPMSMLPMMISMLVSVSVSITRLNRFLNSPQLENYINRDNQLPDDIAIRIENGSFCWDSSGKTNKGYEEKKNKKQNKSKKVDNEEATDEPLLQGAKQKNGTNSTDKNGDGQPKSLSTLNSIDLQIKKGSLVAIVGHVGSGKSSLLSAMLGEMECMQGNVSIDCSTSIAYVSQQAWIQNATLKENILFGQPFVKSRYESIIDMCALKPDIAILPGGDQTEIGEKGINLSGGQKQRVAIARACYSNSDMLIMDDPLSAVDSHVAKHIFNKVISSKTGYLKNKTRVLVTNNISLLPDFDQIIVLNHGQITEIGTYRELMSNSGRFSEFVREYSSENDARDNDDSNDHSMNRTYSLGNKDEQQTPVKKNDKKLIESERTETGEVKLSVYMTYFRSLTYLWICALMFGFIGMQTASVFSNVWLAVWSNDKLISENITNEDVQLRNHRLAVYGGLGFAQAICVMFGAIAMANGVVHSSRTLHRLLMERIMRSPVQFFDTTPLGRIVNRFSKDIDTIDSTIPHTLRGWLICFLQVLSTFILIIFKINVFLLVAIPLLIFYYLVQKFYVATSRQLKRLESVTRSPIYSHFGETLAGVSTIRAYGCAKRFIRESNQRVDTNQRCYFPSFIANRWLAVRLEFCGNMITFFCCAFTVWARDSFFSEPGFAGLIMTYAMSITQTLNWLIRMTSEMETNVVSVERIEEYCQIPSEREWIRPNGTNPILKETWPEKGEILFDEYSVRYREGMNLVLNNICIRVKSGEKIGIVGRTGAGKSTLTLALFRLLEKTVGKIVIDDVDISLIGLHELRSKLSIIPQDPVLFSGTIRSNLDPFGMNSDEQLWRALEHSHLKEYVSSLESGLDYPVSENGENLSVGQRQLICLARALLRKTKILILDEATAAIDLETDSLIQQTIRTEFADCTILTIAHRLNTIIDSSRVLVLDKGKVVEFDPPGKLLEDRRSRFYALAKDARLV